MAISYNRESRTYHAEYERAERILAIEEKLGLTNIVIEISEKRDGRFHRIGITSSGVIVIRNSDIDKIVTVFMAREYQAKRICKAAGKKCVPPKLLEKIKKNARRYPELFEL